MSVIFFTVNNLRRIQFIHKTFRLATPLAIDQLGYTDQEAVEKVGIVFSAGCALTAVSFACSGPLAKRQVVSFRHFKQFTSNSSFIFPRIEV